ncbi:unnamed protein product [Caenorhabditis sp. 36 PRJEB53466]|nr:unnamed protein product [Caenorhabditis sp. 36 PRJEB53466]
MLFAPRLISSAGTSSPMPTSAQSEPKQPDTPRPNLDTLGSCDLVRRRVNRHNRWGGGCGGGETVALLLGGRADAAAVDDSRDGGHVTGSKHVVNDRRRHHIIIVLKARISFNHDASWLREFEENHNRRRADSNVSNTSSRRSSSNDSTLLLHDQNTDNYRAVPTSYPSQHMPSIIRLSFCPSCSTSTSRWKTSSPPTATAEPASACTQEKFQAKAIVSKFEENHNRRRADSDVSNTSSRRSSSNNSTLLLHDQNTYNYGVVPTSHPSQHMPSIIWILFLMFKWDVITAMFVKLLSDILLFCNPMLLKLLLEFTEQLERPMWQGVVLAFTMFGSAELSSILLSHFLCLMYRVGTHVQTCLTSAVYRKTLRLSNAARREKTVGVIVNLMTIDIHRFQQITLQTMQFCSNPFQIGFVLEGTKDIKLYAWGPPMENVIEDLREKELGLIKKAAFLRTFSDMLSTASSFFVVLSTFMTFICIDPKNMLTPEIAFASLTLFNQLSSRLSQVADLITQSVQVVVSNRRLKEFLKSEKLNEDAIDRKGRDNNDIIAVNDSTLS